MTVSIINSLKSAARAYLATPTDDPNKAELFEAVTEWLYASYEADGYSKSQLAEMDIEAATQEYIERLRLG
jgi:hypothetical protein